MTDTDLIRRADQLQTEVLRRIAERDLRRRNLVYLILEGPPELQERACRELTELCGVRRG